MTKEEARSVAMGAVDSLPEESHSRLKSVDVIPRLHQGTLTVRMYFWNHAAPDPEPYIFTAEEIL